MPATRISTLQATGAQGTARRSDWRSAQEPSLFPFGKRMSAIRLLLVDDEAALTDLLKKYLERIGYVVDSCGSADEALALFGEHPQRYALVLTDLTLPGMSGEAMLEKMRERDPEVRAIVASGYPYQPRLPLV